MKLFKHSRIMLLTTACMMALVLAACGSSEEAEQGTSNTDTTSVSDVATTSETSETSSVSDVSDAEDTATVSDVADAEDTTTDTEATDTTTASDVSAAEDTTTDTEAVDTTSGEASSDVATITKDEAINMVKAEMGEDYSYIPADELEEKDGDQYYVIYVKKLLEQGTLTTISTYMVKTDGSVLFDKEAVNYTGEYVRTGEVGEVTFVVSEDGTFEMITTGEVNQVVSGVYKLGITDSASVVKLLLHPNKNVVDGEEKEVVENSEGTAVIEGNTLTLSMQSQDSVFTKK